ncbi:MAG: hypothetical protein R3332_04875 [Pseudohongiellaceae bacterium]|nr:hypothetical protein [Pseudohongiellaceae bacterium]
MKYLFKNLLKVFPQYSPPLGMADINDLNEETLKYLHSLPSAEINERLQSITLEYSEVESNLEMAKAILKENGILVIKNFMNRNLAIELGERCKETILYYANHLKEGETTSYEDESALAQLGPVKLKGYRQLVEYSKAVVHLRSGQDKGMIDTFNIDRILPESCVNTFLSAFSKREFPAVLGMERQSLKDRRNLNVYLNRGVTSTRGFHIDSEKTQLKSFLYMSDVDSVDSGPYCYSIRSHSCPKSIRVNRAFSMVTKQITESPIVKISSLVPVLGPAGTLVVSDQRGIHRGLPQCADALRLVAVLNYQPST